MDVLSMFNIDINPRAVIRDMRDFIYSEWDKLCREFNIRVPIYINTGEQNLKLMWDLCYKNSTTKQGPSEFIRDYCDYPKDSSIYTVFHGVTTEGDVVQHVTVSCENLYLLIIEYMDRIDMLKEYFRVSLKHEMGHCKANIELYVNSYDVYCKEYDQTREMLEKWIQEHPEPYSEEEYEYFYYSTPQEKRANDAVGLTADELWAASKLLYLDEEEEPK